MCCVLFNAREDPRAGGVGGGYKMHENLVGRYPIGTELRPMCDLESERAEPLPTKPLEELVEPDGIEPTTSTMPLNKKSNGNKDMI